MLNIIPLLIGTGVGLAPQFTVDVMGYISAGRAVADTECIYCNSCKQRCPAGAIR